MAVTGLTDTMYAGNPRTFTFTVTDEDASGSPAKDLTDLTPKLTLSRISASTGLPLKTPEVEKTGTVTDAPNGVLTVALVPADTADLEGEYYLELELFDLSDVGVVVATGTLTIQRNVTNT